MEQNIYQKNGFIDRDDYLETLAGEFGIDRKIVDAASDLLGEVEDFDALVSYLEDNFTS
jgi:hypothetical protein